MLYILTILAMGVIAVMLVSCGHSFGIEQAAERDCPEPVETVTDEALFFFPAYRGLDRGVLYRTVGRAEIEDATYFFVRSMDNAEAPRRCILSTMPLPSVFILSEDGTILAITP